ncbi:MAG: RNA polymerase sigma factor [Bacteroidales bacterium]|nr:RNA polymerase sigma factor [Bacteroidales bacterium]
MTRAQFTSYVETTQRPLRRFLVALCCGDGALADDIAQDTYVKAYLASDTFRDDAAFFTWIHKIAYNTYLSYKRSNRRTESLDGSAETTAVETADATFRYQALYEGLGRLSDKERNAILLHYLEGYAVKEIADMTDASQDAVRQQLSRGRVHLKCLLNSSSL